MGLKKSSIISGLAASYGKDKSEQIINKIIKESGVLVQEEYNKEEANKICNELLNSNDRLLKIIGNSLRVKIMLMK